MSDTTDPEVADKVTRERHVIKKIDRVLIPQLIRTYVLNFMDKVVLSSATVSGIRDDNVHTAQPLRRPLR